MRNSLAQPRTPTRDYNHLDDRGDFFIKSSAFSKKIEAEAHFYEMLPNLLKKFYPRFLGRSSEGRWPKGYAIEKIFASDASIHEIGLVGNDQTYYSKLFALLDEYLALVPKKELSAEKWESLFNNTIIKRDIARLLLLKEASVFSDVDDIFAKNGFAGIDQFVNTLHAELMIELMKKSNHVAWASHGDLCLSNILVCGEKLYLVDPRGLESDEEGYLIPEYDLAKLSQCLIGAYDFINHSVGKIPSPDRHIESFKRFIADKGVSLKSVRLIESSHFVAMLPLHLSHPDHVRSFALQAIESYRGAIAL